MMINDNTDEVIEELFQLLHRRYWIGLETSMKDSEFVFDCVQFLYYKCHQIILYRGGSYIDSPDWIRIKKQ